MPSTLKPPLARAAILAASFAASSALVLAVGTLFHQASSSGWLRDAPLARDAVARCHAQPERQLQQACVKHLVAAARERDAGARHLLAQAGNAQ